MKQKMTFLLLVSYLLIPVQLVYADVFEVLVPNDQKVLIVGEIKKREHALETLKQEKEKLFAEESLIKTQQDLNKTNDLIASYKHKLALARESEKDYYNTILGILNETAQLLLDIQLLRQKGLQTIDTHISILENYLKDPYFKSAKTEVSAVYLFDDLQKSYQDLVSIKEKVNQQNEQLATLKKEREAAKSEIIGTTKELKEKERERANFSEGHREHAGLNDAKLLDFETRLLAVKKEWHDLNLKELGREINMLALRLELLLAQKDVIETDLDRIDRALRVSDLEVLEAQEQLVNSKAAAANIQAQYSQDIRQFTQDKQLLKEQFEKIVEQFKIDLRILQELDEWNLDLTKFDSEQVVYSLGYLNEKNREIDTQIDYLEVKKTLEKVRLILDEVMVKVITSWHKISQRSLRSEEDIEHEKNKYAINKTEAQRVINSYRDKQELISKSINQMSRAQLNLESLLKNVKKNSHKLVLNYGTEHYDQMVLNLEEANKLLISRIDLNRKLTDAYTTIIGLEKEILRHIEQVEERLSKIGLILQRSKHAISWENIKNIGPNLSMFMFGLKNIAIVYFSDLTFRNIWQWLKDVAQQPATVYFALGLLLIWFLIFLLLRLILPVLKFSLLALRPKASNLGVLWGGALLVVEILNNCLLSMMIWSTLFFMFMLGAINGIGLQVLFYLISIPYLCYMTSLFVNNLIAINSSNGYVIVGQVVQDRFMRVLCFFVYSTIIILFFREAFLLVAYESDLPKVLSALYSVIVRAAIIFLIGKDELVSVIPKRGAIWDLARNYVTFYYYPLLISIISIMVLSDPYILGFNKLVAFVFGGVISTLAILFLARWLQNQVRKLAVYAFFYATDSGSRERFDNAKTWYGLLIILIYLTVCASCVLLLAKIWGYSLYLSDVQKWLNYELFVILGGNGLIPITPKSFMVLLGYLMFGIWLAWAFEHFVLQRVFSILLVDRGAQNTVSIISKYFIGIIAISIGLSSIKMGGFIIYVLGALAFGVVWAIKDPVNDFISYFIILLDRTVKIGDYIEVDDRIVGVVRKISPRSVLLRRKNSVSIVVPNSKLTSMPVYNWGYTRGFFAFKDIEITVPYSANTKLVREILQKVLSENLNILKSPAPVIRLNEFGESGYVFMIRGFLSSINVLNQWDIASDIRLEVVSQLRQAGIIMAPPVRLMVNHADLRRMYNLDEEQADPNQILDDSSPGIKE